MWRSDEEMLARVQSEAGRRLRRRRIVVGAAAGTAAVLAAGSVVALAAASRGPQKIRVASERPSASTTTTSPTASTEPPPSTTTTALSQRRSTPPPTTRRAPAASTTTTTPSPYRLRRTYATPGYRPDSTAIGDFRVDPPPDTLQAAMTVDQVRDAVAREGDHWFSNSSAPITYRFGVFHGYGGNGRIDDVPGWLVLQAPIEVYPHCPVNTPPSSCQPKPGYQVEVVSDGDGSRLAGVVQQTGPPPDLG